MNTTCPVCRGKLIQTGAERGIVTYKCRNCQHQLSVVLQADNNVEYWQKRSQILGHVRQGIMQWESTRWESLLKEVQKFMASYEDARGDIYFVIAQVACMTSGFHNMKSEKYKECKQLFKITEKVYKSYCKTHTADVSTTGNDGFTEYEEYRELYKKCRSEYRNEQLLWKAVFFFTKKLIPIPKL